MEDTRAIAAALNTDAVKEVSYGSDVPAALKLSKAARKLDDRAPYIRAAYGTIMGLSGNQEQSIAELQSASELRDDAVRQLNLAQAFLAVQKPDRAEEIVNDVLEQHPDYAAAARPSRNVAPIGETRVV